MTRATPASLVLPAPAKINLFLHITGRRADGYHELQTLFQLLDFGDELRFTRRDDGQLRLVDNCPTIDARDNLVMRAAQLLAQHCGRPLGADITLEKRLPSGGGLGGGSSDAATTLLGLDRLYGLGLARSELASLGLQLGADVPVFIHGQTAFGEGVGERLQPVETAAGWYIVIKPPVEVPTAAVFAHPHLTRDSRPLRIRAFFDDSPGATALRNDCESVVCSSYPQVAEALEWLRQYGEARLTGTGSCLFSRCDEEHQAREILGQLPGHFTGFVARAVQQSPTHQALGLDAGQGS